MNGIKKRLMKTVNLLIRKVIGLLPRKIRFEVYRNKVSIPPNNPEIVFKLAQTQSELEQAFQILHDAYVGSGFMKPHSSGMRVTPYHALPSTSTLIATRHNKVIATVSIIRDSGLGLPLETIFNIKQLKERGRRVAEISSLAIHSSYRGNNGEVLFPLLKYLYQYCVNFFGVDYMVIAVNPSRADFYQAILFFQQISSQIVAKYDFVQGAPALGAYLDLRLLYQTLATYYGNKKDSKNFFKFFTGDTPSNFVYPNREFYKITDPVMTPEMLNYFFNYKTDIFKTLTPKQSLIISSQYSDKKYKEVLPTNNTTTFISKEARTTTRFEVGSSGRLIVPGGTRIIPIQILDVSETGFAAFLESPIRFGESLRANIAIGDFNIADLKCLPVWTDCKGKFGFIIEEASDNWFKYISHLEDSTNNPQKNTSDLTKSLKSA